MWLGRELRGVPGWGNWLGGLPSGRLFLSRAADGPAGRVYSLAACLVLFLVALSVAVLRHCWARLPARIPRPLFVLPPPPTVVACFPRHAPGPPRARHDRTLMPSVRSSTRPAGPTPIGTSRAVGGTPVTVTVAVDEDEGASRVCTLAAVCRPFWGVGPAAGAPYTGCGVQCCPAHIGKQYPNVLSFNAGAPVYLPLSSVCFVSPDGLPRGVPPPPMSATPGLQFPSSATMTSTSSPPPSPARPPPTPFGGTTHGTRCRPYH